MNLPRTKAEALRELGWSVVRENARRPRTVPSCDVLYVGEDVSFVEDDADRRLASLDGNR